MNSAYIKFNLYDMYGKKLLMFVSLLFMATIVSSIFISDVNGLYPDIDRVEVKTEAELRNAIDASNNDDYIIVISKNIALEKPLEIVDGKSIILVGFSYDVYLIGADGLDTIIVKSGGILTLWSQIVVTHADGDTGRGVYVERGGLCVIRGAIISGNAADLGGGVYNKGTFDLRADEDRDGEVTNNTATKGGGVYNAGTFKGNEAQVYGNTATSGEGNDVFTEETVERPFYLLLIGVIVIVVVVGGLLFYRYKKQKQPMTQSLVESTVI
jgi:hypothetical protein